MPSPCSILVLRQRRRNVGGTTDALDVQYVVRRGRRIRSRSGFFGREGMVKPFSTGGAAGAQTV